MASMLKADRLRVLGGLVAVWGTFDTHSIDGTMDGYTLASLDEVTGWRGFSAAMLSVRWLEETGDGLRLPEFDEHNGKSAKRRATDAKRKESDREEDKGAHCSWTPSGNLSASDADILRTDCAPEKEQEKEKESPTETDSGPALRVVPPTPPPDFDGHNAERLNGKAVVAIAAAWELPESWGFDAEALGFKPQQVLTEAEKFRQYWTAGKGSGTRRSVKGWRQSWSNWLGKAAERQQR